MPLIQVTLWRGRDEHVKTQLIQNVTKATAETLGVPQDHIRVILYEVGREDWGVGGTPASKLDWGY